MESSADIDIEQKEKVEDGLAEEVISDKTAKESVSVDKLNEKKNVENDENIEENGKQIDEELVENFEKLKENVDTIKENGGKTTGKDVSVTKAAGNIDENTDTVENKEGAAKSEENEGIKNDGNENEEESDGEIVDSETENEDKPTESHNKIDYNLDVPAELDQLDYDEDSDDNINLDTNQIGKSNKTEKLQENVMSEGEIESSDGEVKSDGEESKNFPSFGFYPDEREDGEMVDPMEGPAVPREICRFFERGSCTWGDRCRFIHPGINDKGEYRMFDDGRDRNKQFIDEKHQTPAIDPRDIPPNFMDGPPQMETAWERGLRHAKEMRKRSMQRKVEEPDFLRKREIISTNEALNVDRDMDFIAHKPLVDDIRGFDPFAELDADERYAVPPPEVLKRLKRFERREDRRSPGRRESPSRRRGFPPPMNHNNRRRSPPRPHNHPQHRDMPPYMRQPHNNFMHRGPPIRDGMEGKVGMEHRRSPDFRREVESRIVPAQRENKSPRQPGTQANQQRGDNWQDPWARGRQKERSKSHTSSSGSSSSGSSSRSSYSSRSSSFSSRSSSRSSDSSSLSRSGSSPSKSPGPKKSNKKVLKKLKNEGPIAPKTTKVAAKPASPKKSPKAIKPMKQSAKPVPQAAKKKVASAKPVAKAKTTKERGRTKTKTKGKRSGSSSTSEFSHSSSSSRSRSRSQSGSESGSSSSSGSGSSSGSSSDSLSEDENAKKTKKNVKTKSSKVSVPSKPGGKNVKMTIINKPKQAAKGTSSESRKRPASQISNPPTKKVSAIANRRVELLEQLKVVENAILKKRAKLT